MYHHINLILLIACYTSIILGIVFTESSKRTACIVSGVVGLFVYPLIMEILINLYAMCNKSKEDHNERHHKLYRDRTPICYTDDYNIKFCGIEKCHPFDSCKYQRGNLYDIEIIYKKYTNLLETIHNKFIKSILPN